MNKYFGIISVVLCGLLGGTQLHGLSKKCLDKHTAAPKGYIDYTYMLPTKKGIDQICYVQLATKERRYIRKELKGYPSLQQLTDKFIEEASHDKDPVLKEVLDDFKFKGLDVYAALKQLSPSQQVFVEGRPRFKRKKH